MLTSAYNGVIAIK